MHLSGLRLGNSRTSRRAVHIAIRGLSVLMAAGPKFAVPGVFEASCASIIISAPYNFYDYSDAPLHIRDSTALRLPR